MQRIVLIASVLVFALLAACGEGLISMEGVEEVAPGTYAITLPSGITQDEVGGAGSTSDGKLAFQTEPEPSQDESGSQDTAGSPSPGGWPGLPGGWPSLPGGWPGLPGSSDSGKTGSGAPSLPDAKSSGSTPETGKSGWKCSSPDTNADHDDFWSKLFGSGFGGTGDSGDDQTADNKYGDQGGGGSFDWGSLWKSFGGGDATGDAPKKGCTTCYRDDMPKGSYYCQKHPTDKDKLLCKKCNKGPVTGGDKTAPSGDKSPDSKYPDSSGQSGGDNSQQKP